MWKLFGSSGRNASGPVIDSRLYLSWLVVKEVGQGGGEGEGGGSGACSGAARGCGAGGGARTAAAADTVGGGEVRPRAVSAPLRSARAARSRRLSGAGSASGPCCP